MAVSGISIVDLLVIVFFSKQRTFSAKIASCRPSTSWIDKKPWPVVSCLLHSRQDFWLECVDFGNAYIAVRTNYVHSFQVCCFPTLPLFFVLCLQNPKSACIGIKC